MIYMVCVGFDFALIHKLIGNNLGQWVVRPRVPSKYLTARTVLHD